MNTKGYPVRTGFLLKGRVWNRLYA
jgi:hypothetical protein